MLVTVGSDFHPFDRLVGGVDTWLSGQPSTSVKAVVQHGTAQAPRNAEAHDYLSHAELMDRLANSDIIVTQGGPMGIVEARRCGRIPIVMPRVKRLGEVVDDHQVSFCRQLASTGDIVMVENVDELCGALDRAVMDPQSLRLSSADSGVDTRRAVAVFAREVECLSVSRRWRRWGRN